MIIRMYPTDGLKGQQAISPGQRLGYRGFAAIALKGQKLCFLLWLLPFQGGGLNVLSPRALPWADGSLPLRGVIGYKRIIISSNLSAPEINKFVIIRAIRAYFTSDR